MSTETVDTRLLDYDVYLDDGFSTITYTCWLCSGMLSFTRKRSSEGGIRVLKFLTIELRYIEYLELFRMCMIEWLMLNCFSVAGPLL